MTKSKIAAWAALILVIALTVVAFAVRMQWWMMFDVFFLFIAAFSHLMAVMFGKIIPSSSRTLDRIAFGSLFLALISFLFIWLVL